jgi:aspartate carbamoyltransferase catalytic subunit
MCPYCGKQIAVDNIRHSLTPACVAHAKQHQKGSLYTNDVIDAYYESRTNTCNAFDVAAAFDGTDAFDVVDSFDVAAVFEDGLFDTVSDCA